MSDPIDRLGQAVAQAQDAALADDARRRRVAARLRNGTHRAVRPRWSIVAVAAIAAAACVALTHWRTPSAPELTYVTGDDAHAARPGRWLSSPPDRALSLRFSDGSALSLAPSGDLRVESLDPSGATLRVERGTATLAVRHTARTRWLVHAGPFSVRVVGTRFDVGWSPDEATFSLALHEGAVIVTGPTLGERRVHAGERLRVAVREERVEIAPIRAPAPAVSDAPRPPAEAVAAPPVGPAPSAPLEAASAVRARLGADAPRAPSADPGVVEAPSFEWLAADGRYGEAVDAAERAGWEQVLGDAPVDSVLALADAARLARRPARAGSAYAAVHRRAESARDRARAAFFLGRLALDAGELRDAARWFAAAHDDDPGGPLARDAAGRRVEALHSAGDAEAAARAARAYLSQYPSGPHAPLAAQLAPGGGATP